MDEFEVADRLAGLLTQERSRPDQKRTSTAAGERPVMIRSSHGREESMLFMRIVQRGDHE